MSSRVDSANTCLCANGRHVVPTPLQLLMGEVSSGRGSRAIVQCGEAVPLDGRANYRLCPFMVMQALADRDES